jgi:hypothetical protein
MIYEVEVRTVYYDTVRVEATDPGAARTKARSVEPKTGLTVSECEAGDVKLVGCRADELRPGDLIKDDWDRDGVVREAVSASGLVKVVYEADVPNPPGVDYCRPETEWRLR